jgi:uncharacterized SAM-binding protein YcdF (DUF218 family)
VKLKKRYIAALVILGLLIVIAVTHALWLEAMARFLIVRDEISEADVIVILGGGAADRVWQGVDLYQSGYGKWMIATGMKHEMPGLVVTWPELARREAVSLGVPEEAFITEDRPTSTYEDAIYVKEDMLNRGFRSAIIVSSPHHTRRARMIFRKVFKDHKDISLLFVPVEDGKFQVEKWWTRENEMIGVVNEYCKLVFYFFKYII